MLVLRPSCNSACLLVNLDYILSISVSGSSHNDHVFDIAWSPTADFLVTASHDRMWKLWQPRVLSLRNSCFMADNQQHYASSNLPADGMQMEHTVVV